MRGVVLSLVLLSSVCSARAGLLYAYAHDGGTSYSQSSWWDPDGSDGDLYAYEKFVLNVDSTIQEVDWRGFEAFSSGVFDFSVMFYHDLGNGQQPVCGNPQLPEGPYAIKIYWVGGVPPETNAGVGGFYDFKYKLPTSLALPAGTYWIKIEASCTAPFGWGIARGLPGNGTHFQFSTGAAMFQTVSNDLCLSLYGTQSQTVAPSSLTLNLGKYTSGDVSSLAGADGVDYVACKFIVPSQTSPFVQLQVDGTTALASLSSYSLSAKAHMLSNGAFQVAVQAYNFTASSFDASTTSNLGATYSTTTVTPGSPASYLGANGAVRGRIQVRQTGPSTVSLPCVGIDQVLWNLQN